jgi:GNAT superfamily N-acetyltransferase
VTDKAPDFLDAVTFRQATAADLPALVAMRDDLNALERSGCPHACIVPLSVKQFTEVWGYTLDSPDHCWRLIEIDGRPAGFGLIYLSSPRTDPPGAFVHWAYLIPEARRMGLGRRLLDELLAWARSHGADRVELQFIDGNEAARGFWTSLGFRPYATKCVLPLAGPESP